MELGIEGAIRTGRTAAPVTLAELIAGMSLAAGMRRLEDDGRMDPATFLKVASTTLGELLVYGHAGMAWTPYDPAERQQRRWRLRQLAALPGLHDEHMTVGKVAEQVSGVLGSPDWCPVTVLSIMEGWEGEPALPEIQKAGRMLYTDVPIDTIVETTDLGGRTVRAISTFVGASQYRARRDLMRTVDLLQSGVASGSRTVARQTGWSKSKAERLTAAARCVLAEIADAEDAEAGA